MPACYSADMPRQKIFITKTAAQTKRLAKQTAGAVLATFWTQRPIHAHIISLEGNLGAGKTTFTQGFARALGIKEKITSPTFVVMKRYMLKRSTTNNQQPTTLYHIDCYRLRKPQELEAIGFGDIMKNLNAIVLVEWGDHIREILPKDRMTIRFAHAGGNKRKISLIDSLVLLKKQARL